MDWGTDKVMLMAPKVSDQRQLPHAGKMTGLVVDIGDGVTHIIPVIEGCSFPHLTRYVISAHPCLTEQHVSCARVSTRSSGQAMHADLSMQKQKPVKSSLTLS